MIQKEKETILLTEVEINGKAAQLDGTYALEKKGERSRWSGLSL